MRNLKQLAFDLEYIIEESHLDNMRPELFRVLDAIYSVFQDFALYYADEPDALRFEKHAQLFEALAKAAKGSME